MNRTIPVPSVGIPLRRAVLCPNDDNIYDADRWRACPTCQNGDRIYLSRFLEVGAENGDRTRQIQLGRKRRAPETFAACYVSS
jgi:hypothetical protein